MISGQFKGTDSVTACLVPAGFALEQDAIDFQAHARRCAANSGGGKATEYPPEIMKAIASGVINYASLVVFKGTDKVEGRACDHYTYAYKTTIMNKPGTMNGDLWLSDAVPFGLVKESATTVDAAGKALSKYETVLVETGTSAPGRSHGPALGPDHEGGVMAETLTPGVGVVRIVGFWDERGARLEAHGMAGTRLGDLADGRLVVRHADHADQVVAL